MQFRILDGLTPVPVSSEDWSEWHASLNEKQGINPRLVDCHTLVMGRTRIQVKTLFTGGPNHPWITFVTGYPGKAEETGCLGHARETHHCLVQTLLDMGWKLNPDFNPANYTGE